MSTENHQQGGMGPYANVVSTLGAYLALKQPAALGTLNHLPLSS